ncbi:MAG: thioredoxin fold domain-containing protein [Bacteroidales bacterium]|nr:thioredoxin fold domain-containing protein [Bacteroidales bacterium]
MKRYIILIACAMLAVGAQAQVKWHSIDDAAAAKIGSRLYFVDFYTSWCGYCKKMDRETFTDSTVAKILNRYYYPVKFDAEVQRDVVWFGKTYHPVKKGRNLQHEFAAGLQGYPTYGLFRPDGTPMQQIPGFYPAREFVIVLWYFASGDNDRYAYEQYRKIFDEQIRPEMERQLKKQ